MKITAIRNFSANDVHGFPGYVLTQEDMEAIANVKEEMIKEGLIKIEEGQPACEAPGSSGIIDNGEGAKDDLPDSPEDAVPEEDVKPKPTKKKKK